MVNPPRAAWLAALAVTVVAGCNPEVAQKSGPPPLVVVEFDPGAPVPVTPTPNDLAIDPSTHRVVVPSSPTDSPAQKEFNQTYLGTLDGFPFESTVNIPVSGPLDPKSIGPLSVVGVDLTESQTSAQPALLTLAPVFDSGSLSIRIQPPGGAWTRAHRYAIALLAGPRGLRGAAGEPVTGSPTWALVSGSNPVVNCPHGDLSSPACTLAVDVIPSTKSDPAERFADQLQKARSLETLRRQYAPLLAQIEHLTGLAIAQIPMVFTFTIVDAGEVTFDPANGVIPFPNDALLRKGRVTLPNPRTGKPITIADCLSADPTLQLYCGLNTLDGFSTVAPPVSENSLTAGAVEQASIEATSLNVLTAGLAPVKSAAPASEQTTPSFAPCLNCLSSLGADGHPQTSPQQLQWKLDTPLVERTTYLAWVTGGVKDGRGIGVVANPTFALVRLANPLVVNGHSAVNVLTDAQAAQLEPLRAALKPAIDGLVSKGIPRKTLALAWAFTTQSEASTLDALRLVPALVPDLSASPHYVVDVTAQYQALASVAGIANFAASVGKVWTGVYVTPVAVTGPGGTFDVLLPAPEPVTFTMAIPRAAPPAGGYPVSIFGHDLTRWRGDFIALAGALADPGLGPLAQVTIAADGLDHGDRSSCTGSASATMLGSDDAACADPSTQKCDEGPVVGRCVARDAALRLACTPGPQGAVACANAGQGACLPTGTCEGGDFLRDGHGILPATLTTFQRPVISGWNLVNLTNLFATRDNLRQDVIDQAQLVRVLRGGGSTSLAAQTGIPLDTAHIGYVGQSVLGIGALHNAVSPDTTNVVLNVPGAVLPQIVLQAPAFSQQRSSLLALLATQGIQVGTPAFDQFVSIAQWVLDPADPINVAWRLTHPVDLRLFTAPRAERRAFIQFIENDLTTPNAASIALVAAASPSFEPTLPGYGCVSPLFCYEFTAARDAFDATTAPLALRHGFLLAPPSFGAAGVALTAKAQAQVATFLATGRLP
jgi:hypothetical protein